jgi:hypothetical protein
MQYITRAGSHITKDLTRTLIINLLFFGMFAVIFVQKISSNIAGMCFEDGLFT